LVVVAKSPQHRPGGLVPPPLDEQAVQEEEALQGDRIVVDAIGYVLLYDGLHLIQDLGLQGSVEATPLKKIQLVVIQQIVPVDVADLEDAHQRLLASRCELEKRCFSFLKEFKLI